MKSYKCGEIAKIKLGAHITFVKIIEDRGNIGWQGNHIYKVCSIKSVKDAENYVFEISKNMIID